VAPTAKNNVAMINRIRERWTTDSLMLVIPCQAQSKVLRELFERCERAMKSHFGAHVSGRRDGNNGTKLKDFNIRPNRLSRAANDAPV
jgi:hypothetical protein